WSLSARAQEPGRVYRLALVLPVGRDEPASLAFLDELRIQGFVEGKNLVIVGGLPTSNEQAAAVVPLILQAAPDAITTGGDFIAGAFKIANAASQPPRHYRAHGRGGITCDLSMAGNGRRRRSARLWSEFYRCFPAARRNGRQSTARRQTGGFADRTADQV